MTDHEFFELLRNYFKNGSTAIEATINNTIINRINDLEKKLIKLQYQQTENTKYIDKYHNLEEQLGCPLEVVFKALENGFYDEYGNWYKNYDFDLKYDWLLSNPNDKYLIFDVEDIEFKLRDYKKTWWLKKDGSE